MSTPEERDAAVRQIGANFRRPGAEWYVGENADITKTYDELGLEDIPYIGTGTLDVISRLIRAARDNAYLPGAMPQAMLADAGGDISVIESEVNEELRSRSQVASRLSDNAKIGEETPMSMQEFLEAHPELITPLQTISHHEGEHYLAVPDVRIEPVNQRAA